MNLELKAETEPHSLSYYNSTQQDEVESLLFAPGDASIFPALPLPPDEGEGDGDGDSYSYARAGFGSSYNRIVVGGTTPLTDSCLRCA